MATRMQQRRGTAAAWAAQNPVLEAGEIGFEIDTKVLKMGDGVNAWNDLQVAYLSTGGGGMTGDLYMQGNKIIGQGSMVNDVDFGNNDLLNVGDIVNPGSIGPMGGDIDMNDGYIWNLADPANPDDAVNRRWSNAAHGEVIYRGKVNGSASPTFNIPADTGIIRIEFGGKADLTLGDFSRMYLRFGSDSGALYRWVITWIDGAGSPSGVHESGSTLMSLVNVGADFSTASILIVLDGPNAAQCSASYAAASGGSAGNNLSGTSGGYYRGAALSSVRFALSAGADFVNSRFDVTAYQKTAA